LDTLKFTKLNSSNKFTLFHNWKLTKFATFTSITMLYRKYVIL